MTWPTPESLVPACIVLPFASAALLMAFERSLPRQLADLLAVASAFAVAILCGVLAVATTDAPIVQWLGGWTPRAGVPTGIALVVDPPAAALGVLAAVSGATALLFSWRIYDAVGPLFHVLLLMFVGGAVTVAFAGDLFTLFIALELVGVTSYALTGYQIERAAPIHGSFSLATTDSVASIAFLLGIALLYAATGALNLAAMGPALAADRPGVLVIVGVVLVVVALAAKLGMAPFHFAHADAHTAAPTPALVAFSGVLLALALFSYARLHAVLFGDALGSLHAPARSLIAGSAAVGSVLLALMCIVQRQLKRMLAFATLCHASLAMVGATSLSSSGVAGAGLYLAAIGAVEAAAFLGVGLLLHRHDTVEEHELHGQARGMRWVGACWFVAAWAMLSLPPFASSLGKHMIGSAWKRPWLSAAMAAASILCAAAMLRVGARVFFGWGPREADDEDGDEHEADDESDAEPPSKPSWWVPATMTALLALAAALTLVAGPAITAARDFVDAAHYRRMVLGGLESSARTIAHAPSMSFTPGDLVRATLAVAIALIAVHGQRMPVPFRAAVALLCRPVPGLRRVHSGHVGDYVTWLVVGAAALAVTAIVAAT